MFNDKLSECPACRKKMTKGFTITQGLTWIPPEMTEQFIFVGIPLFKLIGIPLYKVSRWKSYLPVKAAYYLSYVCQSCEVNIIDYSRTYSRREINELAKSI